MKIATRLTFNTLLFAAVVLVLGLLFASAFMLQRQAFERSLLAHDTMKLSYELLTVSERYLRYPEERPKAQWVAAYGSLAENLDRQAAAAGSPVILNRMRQNLRDMDFLFSTLIEANEREADPQPDRAVRARRLVLLSELITKRARNLSLDAARLASLSNRKVEGINRAIMLFTPLVALVLTGLTAWTSSRIRRSITQLVNSLRAGTEIVGSGNLDHRIGMTGSDEIGQLSAAFDAMTSNLRTLTVSRDELSREMAERRRAEAEREGLVVRLREVAAESARRRAQLEAVLQAMSEGVMIFDMNGRALFLNQAEARINGFPDTSGMMRDFGYFTEIYELTELDGRPVPPERWPVSLVLRGESVENRELRGRRKDTGQEWFFSFSGQPVRDEQGRQILALVITRDITESKRRYEEFRRISRQNELILEYAGEGICGLDVEGRVSFINSMGAHMLGYDRAELLGANSHAAWHYRKPDGSAYPEEECPVHAAYKEETLRSGEEVFWRKDSTGFPVEFSSRPLYEEGVLAGSVVIYRDITERRRGEDELKRLLTELERSNRELEQFAYVASHDLQEPLRMVASYVQLLERKYRGRLDEKADKYIFYAVDGALRMQKLIEGLLAYSRVARGAVFSSVDMNRVVSQVLSNLAMTIGESRAVIAREDLPEVTGDETQLTQLLQNLVSNAIKFRRPGVDPEVGISAARADGEWVFSVRDNGIGIDPRFFNRIFQIFQRLHSREEYPGTGIGLSLCKRIIERHHGRIWVESEQGKGTTFFFALPAKAPAGNRPRVHASERGAKS